ncbi:MAG: phosphate signaling complex protein PhoU [Pseudomonadota bacterium]
MNEHTVTAFDDELNLLISQIAEMGGIAESMIDRSVKALTTADKELSRKVVADDKQLNDLRETIDEQVVLFIARRQPMASDLREAIGTLRMATDIERIGDLGKNIARRTFEIEENLPPKKLMRGLKHLTKATLEQLKDILDAYATRDIEQAKQVWERDDEVDNLYNSLFREMLTYMMEDPRNITYCTHLLFCAKNMERIGDHVTNLAETIIFMVTGSSDIYGGDQASESNT